MTTEEILGLLQNVRKSGVGWTAHCPHHEDHNNSLSISTGQDGETLLHCFVGCAIDDVCSAVKIGVKDLFTNHDGSRVRPAAERKSREEKAPFAGTDAQVEDYRINFTRSRAAQEYVQRRGISLATATDLHFGFLPAARFHEGESWIYKPALAIPHYVNGKLVGVKFRTIDGAKLFTQVLGSSIDGLYAADQLTNVDDAAIVEGPEDAALAISHGFNCAAIVSASSKLSPADFKRLNEFKRIFLIGDQDIAGQKAMQSLQDKLPAERVLRVRIPGFKDVGELFQADPAGFADKLRWILRAVQGSREQFEWADLLDEDEITSTQQIEQYAVDTLVPSCAVTMLFGEEKSGKSLLARYIAKCIANGVPVFAKYATRKMPVLILDLENNAEDMANFRNLFARIGKEKVRCRNRRTGVPALDSPWLLRFCETHSPLIVIDNMTKFLKGINAFDPVEMSTFFDMVLNLCSAGATIVIVHHAKRADVESYANSYSIGAAVSRSYLVVSEDRPQLRRVRLEGQLARSGEPVSLSLVAFPVIPSTGGFGLADLSSTPVDRLVEFVRNQPGSQCTAQECRARKGTSRKRAIAILNQALDEGHLIRKKPGLIQVPEARTCSNTVIQFQNQEPTEPEDTNDH